LINIRIIVREPAAKWKLINYQVLAVMLRFAYANKVASLLVFIMAIEFMAGKWIAVDIF
jgi:hypothetical protein